MHEYRFSNALGYTFEQLADLHNRSFSGYFVPITMSAAQVSDFWRVNQIDANCCVVMHDSQGAFVGMARMGTRGTHGWCGGFGIVPEFRGTGASKILANEMVRVAKESGLTQLQLEVLTQNTAAIKLYERVGFVRQRRLLGLEIATSDLPVEPAGLINSVELASLLSWDPFYTVRPTWSLEIPSLLTGNSEALTIADPDDQLNAFIVRRANGIMQIQAVLLRSQLTASEYGALLRALAADCSKVQIYNEPEESPQIPHYKELGFNEFFSQYDMLLKL
ncbi:GNAT family N-acetyltransferase [Dictyobacter aurantiacus]|uniref:N-acetyltransferase domain-containing protein n=1 Tax=Dictyobacter aurantiacus TaxID=1936993 RepID=A0A401ZGX9_9CHLR|nr:GNAT family N-acetyltransferase [Dictyobacter aurantiacus]GCE06102.1 hypothetical protein KDAU_34310 [Dictyobacter aurantiacus]